MMRIWIILSLLIPLQNPGDPFSAAEAIRHADGEESFFKKAQEQGLFVDADGGTISFPGVVLNPDMPIEYLVVGEKGATHESLFLTKVSSSDLTTALFLIGLNRGTNVQYREKTGANGAEGLDDAYEVLPPRGDGMFVYISWKISEETFQYRAEDLILNVKRKQTVARGPWVFLGSRTIVVDPEKPSVFAADLEQNFISVCFFSSGTQILACADPEGAAQHNFFPNTWLLPEKGTEVLVLLSKNRLEDSWKRAK